MKLFYFIMNNKLYYTAILIKLLLMITGLVYDNDIGFQFQFMLHSFLVLTLGVCLIIYPYFKNQLLRFTILIAGTAFNYMIFFIYPETVTSFILVCFIPAIALLFFNSKLFIFSSILNIIAMGATFYYIIAFDTNNHFSYIKLDTTGNFVNFLSSQLVLYGLFYLIHLRIKQQQLYYEQLQNSERLKMTGQLAAAVAHEIRNPLTTVKGFLQLYRENNTSNVLGANEHFTLMIDELNTAEEVLTQFLTLAKPDKKNALEIVNVNDSLQSVTDLLQSYGSVHDTTINLQVAENCYILANKIEYKQLMINIIKNAIEASNSGDPVIVIVTKQQHFIETQIIDSGFGMTDSELELLGTPFYSLKSSGTGLGLMICYHIVEKYNGTIHFQSSKDEGTTVTIRFPASLPE